MTDIEKRIEALEKRQAQMQTILGAMIFQIGVLLPACKNTTEQLIKIGGFLRDVRQWLQPSKN